jgi:hypothetical protein
MELQILNLAGQMETGNSVVFNDEHHKVELAVEAEEDLVMSGEVGEDGVKGTFTIELKGLTVRYIMVLLKLQYAND